MKKIFSVQGVDCAACAAKLEQKIAKLDGVDSAAFNFFSSKLTVEIIDDSVVDSILKTIRKTEPDAAVKAM